MRERLAWNDLEIGSELTHEAEAPVTRTDVVRYAGAAGDFNPVHHDEPYAQGLGLPSIFVMGMLPAGQLSRIVADWFGLANVRFFEVRFVAQVWPDEKLRTTARVTKKSDDGGERQAEIDLEVVNETGEVKLRGRAVGVVGTA